MFNPTENNDLENEILNIDEEPILKPSDLCKQLRRKIYFSRKAISALIGAQESRYRQWERGTAEPPKEFMEKLLAMNEFINSERKNLWEFVEELNRQRKNGSNVFVGREINSGDLEKKSKKNESISSSNDSLESLASGSTCNLGQELESESLLTKLLEEIKKEISSRKKLLDQREMELRNREEDFNLREIRLIAREKELKFKLNTVNDRLRKVNYREKQVSTQEGELNCFAKNIKEGSRESNLRVRDSSYLKRLLS